MQNSFRRAAFSAIVIGSIAMAGCAPRATATTMPAEPPTSAPTNPTVGETGTALPTAPPWPAITLSPGQNYFSTDGVPGFLFSRNVTGYQLRDYDTFLAWSKEGGSRFVRIQLDSMGMGYTRAGAVDSHWASQWDKVFDMAEANGIYVLPVFSGWFDWNEGAGYSTWKSNPLNAANGGPVQNAAELFEKDSQTQKLWMGWMETLVRRWEGKKNIVAWEVFSEVNLASGVDEGAGMEFVTTAAAVIRSADATHRPVTASIADTGTWPNFYRNPSIDFINLHPYPPSAQLDRHIVREVRRLLETYDRPVLIGESGLNAATPDSEAGRITVAEGAASGIRHAIWAAIVSGAMNGRALYWEDSFGIYFPEIGIPFMSKYETEELVAAQFVEGVDFSGVGPMSSSFSSDIWGAAAGNESTIIGWYRDASSEPPDWKVKPVISRATVTLDLPSSGTAWQIDYYDTATGTKIIGSDTFSVEGTQITITLPDFSDDIAFRVRRAP